VIVMRIQMISGRARSYKHLRILVCQAAASPVVSGVLNPAMWILLALRNVALSGNRNHSHWLLDAVVLGTAVLDD
jgi:hypothetical protein